MIDQMAYSVRGDIVVIILNEFLDRVVGQRRTLRNNSTLRIDWERLSDNEYGVQFRRRGTRLTTTLSRFVSSSAAQFTMDASQSRCVTVALTEPGPSERCSLDSSSSSRGPILEPRMKTVSFVTCKMEFNGRSLNTSGSVT